MHMVRNAVDPTMLNVFVNFVAFGPYLLSDLQQININGLGGSDTLFVDSANGLIKGKILTIRPAIVADAPIVPVAWVCGDAPGPGQMTVKGENKTNIPPNYLPVSCRSAVL